MIGWFLCPYKRRIGAPMPTRYCAMDDFTSLIYGEGGMWDEVEVLGNHTIVKVRASATTLQTINAAEGFTRLPKDRLDDSLSDLTPAQKTALRNKIESLGYTAQEIQQRFGSDLGAYTLRDVLRFVASRRLRPRYDVNTDTIICDGPEQPMKAVEDSDNKVQE